MLYTQPQPDFESAESSVMRAVSGVQDASVIFHKGNSPEVALKGNTLNIPQPYIDLSGSQVAAVRGMVDSAALQLKYHDKALHKQLAPMQDSTSYAIFTAAEQARIESIGSRHMTGIAKNIEQKIIYDFLNAPESDPTLPPVDKAVYLTIREQLTGMAPPPITHELMERWGTLVKAKAAKQLGQLETALHDQAAFASLVMQMIRQLKLNESGQHQEEERDGDETSAEAQEQTEESNEQPNKSEPQQQASFEEDLPGHTEPDSPQPPKEQVNPKQQGIETKFRPNFPDYSTTTALPYSTFTTQFDQVIAAEKMFDREELTYLRQQLDIKLAKLKNINRRAANQFLRKLLSQHSKSWKFNLEDGILDGRKLPTLIANPNYLEYCKEELESDNINTIVTLLLDNSGSMRGRPITVAAMSAEILAKTLEACGIKVEILGFTTVEWKGGQSRKLWQEGGSPRHPGRLNDLRHIIYKSADTPWRKARKNLGVMLKEGILKENIDGEAILWAAKRLSFRPEKRRILMVISDGAPVDDSTISANSTAYLDQHLREVIHTLEKKSGIELVAIGIGHDVTRYYSNAVTLREVDELESAIFQQLTSLFDHAYAA